MIAQNRRSGLGLRETSNSDAKHAVVHAQNDRSGLGPIETCYSSPEVTVLHAKTTGGVLDPQGLVILVLKSLFCMHKTIGEDWNLVLCMQNSDFRTRHTSLYMSQTSSVVLSTNNSVLNTRIKRLYWFQPSPVDFACETVSSGPKQQVSMGP